MLLGITQLGHWVVCGRPIWVYISGMNAPKVNPDDYINFVIASPNVVSARQAAAAHPDQPESPAHDAFTRLLHRLEPDPNTLWVEAQPQVDRGDGVLVMDDSTLDKPYAAAIDLVSRHWSGKHHAVVQGINLVTLLWTDGDRHVPCDYRIYHTADGATKNDHFATMIRTAHERGFPPRCVAFDSWYGSVKNLKLVQSCGWVWLTRLKSNRLVHRDRHGTKAVRDTAIAASGTEVWLKGSGLVRVFRIVAPHGGIGYWATNDLTMTELDRKQFSEFSWAIEQYHRGIKQYTGIEGCHARSATAQRNHIGLALRAFLRLESYCFRRGISWFAAKRSIINGAIRAYLAEPFIRLPNMATA